MRHVSQPQYENVGVVSFGNRKALQSQQHGSSNSNAQERVETNKPLATNAARCLYIVLLHTFPLILDSVANGRRWTLHDPSSCGSVVVAAIDQFKIAFRSGRRRLIAIKDQLRHVAPHHRTPILNNHHRSRSRSFGRLGYRLECR